jgi:hypothetical protein
LTVPGRRRPACCGRAVLTDQPDTTSPTWKRATAATRASRTASKAKDTGMTKLPFRDYQMNAVWLELVLIAQDLTAWAKALCLDDELAACEPKRLP